MALTLLYFARLREDLDMAEERIAFSPALGSVSTLLDFLRQRDERWRQVLSGERAFRVAVNQTLADPSQTIADGDEIALFPPVTGG